MYFTPNKDVFSFQRSSIISCSQVTQDNKKDKEIFSTLCQKIYGIAYGIENLAHKSTE